MIFIPCEFSGFHIKGEPIGLVNPLTGIPVWRVQCVNPTFMGGSGHRPLYIYSDPTFSIQNYSPMLTVVEPGIPGYFYFPEFKGVSRSTLQHFPNFG